MNIIRSYSPHWRHSAKVRREGCRWCGLLRGSRRRKGIFGSLRASGIDRSVRHRFLLSTRRKFCRRNRTAFPCRTLSRLWNLQKRGREVSLPRKAVLPCWKKLYSGSGHRRGICHTPCFEPSRSFRKSRCRTGLQGRFYRKFGRALEFWNSG